MANIFVSSDHHFDHAKILTFLDEDGERFRPFDTTEELTELLIERHNAVVGPSDHWYCLGDLMFGKLRNLDSVMSRLNGKKRLVLGNHDYFEKEDFEKYFKWFDKIMESRDLKDAVMTHRPILLGDHHSRIKVNIHGHIHEKVIDDPRYLNVSVEQTNWAPINLEEARDIFKDRGIEVELGFS